MSKKIRIVELPDLPEYRNGGSYGTQTPHTDRVANPYGGKNANAFSTPEIKMRRVLKPTTKENATLEAEKGETVVTNLNHDGLPELYTVGGKPHSKGGTPLNLPENSFILANILFDNSKINEFKKYIYC